MSDLRLRQLERDYHAGRLSGQEWRDILLARDPDRLTVYEEAAGCEQRRSLYSPRLLTRTALRFPVEQGDFVSFDEFGNIAPCMAGQVPIGVALRSGVRGDYVPIMISGNGVLLNSLRD